MFKDIKKQHILIIYNDKDTNNTLCKLLQNEGYSLLQAYNEKQGLSYLNEYQSTLEVVIFYIDFETHKSQEMFEHIQNVTESKIILLSNSENSAKREEYFKHGILDFYVISEKLDYISDDIHQTLQMLQNNQKENILIIDDSKLICKVIQDLLEVRGYNIYIANNAKDGIEILKHNDIIMVILDMELPDIHGLKILEGLRDLNLLSELKVLAISANDNPSLIRDALRGGATNFVKKPFLYEEFVLKVDIMVQSGRSRRIVSEQKQEIEYRLKSFEELLHSTINPMFIFSDNDCIDCNNEALELLEIKKIEHIKNKNIIEVFKDVSKEHQKYLIDDVIDHYFEDVVISGSGEVFDVQIKERNVTIGKKQLKIIAIMDVTDIKRKEKIISQQSKMASMGEMIGNIAHQWRQPLTAISVGASGIKLSYELEIDDREDTIKELDNIVKNTQFLSETIENFRNFLTQKRETTEFYIGQLIEKTLSIIEANLKVQQIKVILDKKKDIQIHAEQNDLMQVFLNIINNSVEAFSSFEKKEIKVIYIHLEEQNDNVVISIYDSAGGIVKEISEKIFEPYFTTKHQAQGTGLGLYMVHQILEKSGGTISTKNESFMIEKEEYFGAKFCISLPIKVMHF